MTRQPYDEFRERLRGIADLRFASAVLQWDQETYMPPGGFAARARQIATLNEEAHRRFTKASFGDLLRKLVDGSAGSPGAVSPDAAVNVHRALEDYERACKLPADFVRRLSEAVSLAFQSWIDARRSGGFGAFAPQLENIVALKQEEASLRGYSGHPYDPLLQEHERGATVRWLDDLFDRFRAPLKGLLDKIASSPQVDNTFLEQSFPKDQQWTWGLDVLRHIGFDFENGRQDISEHPFTVNFSAKDVRVTTRVDPQHFAQMTWSCIHECGHALYEQGLPDEQYGLPLGEACSLAIHESQSRLWENQVGRGLPFWEGLWDRLLEHFPGRFDHLTPRAFYQGINQVKPSPIRTDADELTYHFHILIRYEIEKDLIGGGLRVRDVPAAWTEKYRQYLGISVTDDRQGCLQDVHWSHGSFGYFPTYTLGSLYAAQLYAAAVAELPGLEEGFRKGVTAPLLGWLRGKIHAQGRRYDSEELCRRAVGAPLDPGVFLAYAEKKYGSIYPLPPGI